MEAEIYSKDGQNWITLYTYKNGRIHTLERFKTDGALNKTITITQLHTLKQTAQPVYTQTCDITAASTGSTARITDTLGRTTDYQYDNWNRAVSITNTLGEKSTRTFTPEGRIVAEQAAHGGFYTYSWDSTGNLSTAAEQGSTPVKTEYNPDGTPSRITNRLGEITEYTYDTRGQLRCIKTPGRTEWYTYDTMDRLIRTVTGTAENPAVSDTYTEYKYGKDGRTVNISEGGLYLTTYTLNAWNQVTESAGSQGQHSYGYNTQGQLASGTDGYGNKTSYIYNAIGKVSKITYPDGTSHTYEYNHLGNTTRITDAEGTLWTGTYDKAGRLTAEKGRPGIHKQYTYDALDRITEIKSGGITIEKYTYTERGRTVTVTDGSGSSYTYNKDTFGRLTSEQNRAGNMQRYTYDSEGQLQAKADFAGNTTTIVYTAGGNKKTVSYANGEKEIFTYNMSDVILKAENKTGAITYEYDKAGRLITQTDTASGETITYRYDSTGRRTLMIGAGREVSYTYGRNGELLSVTDNKQRLSASYTYDTMNREIERTNGNGITQKTTYDKAGRTILTAEYGITGILLRAEGYAYDADGRRKATVSHTGAVTRYEYNTAGQLSAVYYPDTKELAETQRIEAEHNGLFYKEHNASAVNGFLSGDEYTVLQTLLNRIQNTLGNRLSVLQPFRIETFTYDANGNRKTKTTPYGTIEYTYDKENRLISSGWNGQAAVTYTYDANGNLLSEIGKTKNAVYEYNAQNRMTYSRITDNREGTAVTSRYEYDAFGRRTAVQDQGSTMMKTLYDSFTFEIVKESPSFENGMFTDTAAQGINYGSNRTGTPTGDRYRYISDEKTSSQNSRYTYIQDSVYKNTSSRYTGERSILYGNGRAAAVSRGGSASYMGTDILGSVRSTTSESGSQDGTFEYDVFGSPITGDYTGGVDFGYLGKPYDSATGLYNYGYRDYSPQTARQFLRSKTLDTQTDRFVIFTTVDPIRDGTNWFAYVNNDPVNWVDPDGLSAAAAVMVAGFLSPDPITTAIAIGIGVGIVTVMVADAINNHVAEKKPVRDKEGNPIPPGNQPESPLGKGANAGPEKITDPSQLGEPGNIPPSGDGKGAIIIGIGLTGLLLGEVGEFTVDNIVQTKKGGKND